MLIEAEKKEVMVIYFVEEQKFDYSWENLWGGNTYIKVAQKI